MKVLLLVQDEQRIILDELYAAIARYCECTILRLTDEEQANLRRYFKKNIDVTQYDRIITFLRFKKELKQTRFIRTIPNLVALEHDAYQNYIDCKYTGKFSYYYSKMPWIRVLSSGASVARKLREEGFDAVFVAKGYDQNMMQDKHLERDIELGFVGSTKSVAYSGRKALLDELSSKENLIVTKTNSGDDYVNMLNRIRFFVSADMGMGEYMIKNFEAMACGCVVFAYKHSDEEADAVGFKDMETVVLYQSVSELIEKLTYLRANPIQAQTIAENGKKLANSGFTFDLIGQKIVASIQPELRQAKKLSFFDRLFNRSIV
ncbi:glycosyltransferase [Pseudomonas sp. F1_0610]|uniref:glycosyltransferase family protein n=1 Tax=Pseudomonas sp. F1_0610 TaxID=3114284 RepID=UPI0039C3716E